MWPLSLQVLSYRSRVYPCFFTAWWLGFARNVPRGQTPKGESSACQIYAFFMLLMAHCPKQVTCPSPHVEERPSKGMNIRMCSSLGAPSVIVHQQMRGCQSWLLPSRISQHSISKYTIVQHSISKYTMGHSLSTSFLWWASPNVSS